MWDYMRKSLCVVMSCAVVQAAEIEAPRNLTNAIIVLEGTARTAKAEQMGVQQRRTIILPNMLPIGVSQIYMDYSNLGNCSVEGVVCRMRFVMYEPQGNKALLMFTAGMSNGQETQEYCLRRSNVHATGNSSEELPAEITFTHREGNRYYGTIEGVEYLNKEDMVHYHGARITIIVPRFSL